MERRELWQRGMFHARVSLIIRDGWNGESGGGRSGVRNVKKIGREIVGVVVTIQVNVGGGHILGTFQVP